ncbi:hypothetical protein J2X31_000121 [Flavobacterium arsenatis]|uniref:Helix-turn-helix domain-containing protein n=1 Tax=Flavobacterium arsenatis TaxID=1484332 RepID=A0ABU1TL48_9FLAO|nr:helix-turn-helix domain-containing protein [Flavobacterium arsenatis]MDR6966128.1 hypothetical protein [Flavobacterium arsenatis]
MQNERKKQQGRSKSVSSSKKRGIKDEEYYDNSDLKRMFNTSESTLYRMRRDQELPYQKLRGKICYPKSYFNTTFLQKCLDRLSKSEND